MAKEYIEREKAIEWFMAFVHMGESDIPVETVITDLKCAIPAADVAPVRHGQWISGVCGNCKFDLRCLTDGESDLEQWVWDEEFDYCPICGAKKDKEE